MNDRQKQIIWKTLLGIIVLTSIAMFVLSCLYLFVFDDNAKNTQIGAFIGTLTGIISPTTIFGIAWKLVINKRHLQNVREIVEPYKPVEVKKVEPKIKKTTKKVYSKNGIDYFVDENGALVIVNTLKNRSKLEVATILESDFIELIETLKK